MKQAKITDVMRMGIATGVAVGAEGLFEIHANDWVTSSDAHAATPVLRLQQKLRGLLTAVVSGTSRITSKL